MPIRDTLPPEIEAIATAIIDAAITVHRRLGPGLLESVYELCLAYELESRGLRVRRQVPVPIIYEKFTLEVGFRIDLLIEETVVVETKAVKELHQIDRQQTLTHKNGEHAPWIFNQLQQRAAHGWTSSDHKHCGAEIG